MTEHVWGYRIPPEEIGPVVHGAALLGRGPGVVVALECVFGHAVGLHLWVRAFVTGPAAAIAWQHALEHRLIGTPTDQADPRAFALIAEVNGKRGPVDQSKVESTGSDGLLDVHASYWVSELADDGLLTVSVTWPLVGLPSTTTVLHLDDLSDLDRRVIPLRG